MPPSATAVSEDPLFGVTQRRLEHRGCVGLPRWDLKILPFNADYGARIANRRIIEAAVDHPSSLAPLENKLAHGHDVFIDNRVPWPQNRILIDRRIGTFTHISGDHEFYQCNRLIEFSHAGQRSIAKEGRWNLPRGNHLLNHRVLIIELEWKWEHIRVACIFGQFAFGTSTVELRHGVDHVVLGIAICVQAASTLGSIKPCLEINDDVGSIGHIQQQRLAFLRRRPEPTVFSNPQKVHRTSLKSILGNAVRFDRSIRPASRMQTQGVFVQESKSIDPCVRSIEQSQSVLAPLDLNFRPWNTVDQLRVSDVSVVPIAVIEDLPSDRIDHAVLEHQRQIVGVEIGGFDLAVETVEINAWFFLRIRQVFLGQLMPFGPVTLWICFLEGFPSRFEKSGLTLQVRIVGGDRTEPR